MASILIIDDDTEVRKMLQIVLQRAGHEVSIAKDGVEGLESYRTNRVELVITDLVMPEKEGLETMMELRQEDQPPKIIAISGAGDINTPRYLAMAATLGADAVLQKPIDLDLLYSNIAELTA